MVSYTPSHCIYYVRREHNAHLKRVTKRNKEYKPVLVFISYSNNIGNLVILKTAETYFSQLWGMKSPRLRQQQVNLLVRILH